MRTSFLSSSYQLKYANRRHPILSFKHFCFYKDPDGGGIADRPGDMVDVFHTLFGVAGAFLFSSRVFYDALMNETRRTVDTWISWFGGFGSCVLHASSYHRGSRAPQRVEGT